MAEPLGIHLDGVLEKGMCLHTPEEKADEIEVTPTCKTMCREGETIAAAIM